MSKPVAIPCLFMRGGTSRGPFFNRNHLPKDLDQLARVLVAAVGAGHRLNIDGMGGGVAVTTKVAMVSPSEDEWADVDYFFAQVNVENEVVDFSPTCGNMLAGVGPAAITMGMVTPTLGETAVKIRSVNTGAKVEAIVKTPHDPLPRVEYDGDAQIDGVPGSAAPILLKFMDVVGSKTGALFPTGQAREVIDGIDVTLLDVAVPMMIIRAKDLGKTGHESAAELDADLTFMQRIEHMRLQAGTRMGLGDVSQKVVPKIGLLAVPQHGGHIAARYFMPKNCHPSMAVTGGICLASCALAPDTVAEGLLQRDNKNSGLLILEHPMGQMEVVVDCAMTDGQFQLHSAGILRTARLLMRGEVMIPERVWEQR